MAATIAARGYAAVTVADVVAEAGVSKRTFYQHFDTKEHCLLACYADSSATVMSLVRQQLADSPFTGRAAILSMLEHYLDVLDLVGLPAVTVFIEVQRAGAEGRRAHRRHLRELSLLVGELVQAASGSDREGLRFLDLGQTVALLGGVNELIVAHAEEGSDVPFGTLRTPMLRFANAVLGQGARALQIHDARQRPDVQQGWEVAVR
jgi:AcrR family transcriptional regulator